MQAVILEFFSYNTGITVPDSETRNVKICETTGTRSFLPYAASRGETYQKMYKGKIMEDFVAFS